MNFEKNKIIIGLSLCSLFILYTLNLYYTEILSDTNAGYNSHDGKLVWQKYNCNACHQVYGLGGYLGPDLTNIYSRKGPAYISAYITSGNITMPKYKIDVNEMESLLHFFKSIDATGSADPRKFKINTNGTIEQ
jgi:nitric oxide reductase subunit C